MTKERPAPNRLKELREAAGLHLVEVAAACKVSERTARRWENRELDIPIGALPALKVLFGGVTSDHLLGLDREPTETGKAAAA